VTWKRALVQRARVIAGVRAFFDSRGFLEVDTPTLLPSPGLDPHLSAFEVETPRGTRYLSTSPEYQMKRLLADGWPRIFQMAKAYRKDEVGERHNPEFTILEWYRAPAEVEEVMRDTEQLVAAVTGGVVTLGDRTIDLYPPLERLTVCAAFERFAGVAREETLAMSETDEDRFFRLLVEEVEPGLARLDRAVFLTEYPIAQASLARKKPDDARVAERFELYAAGVELCNGFGELTCPVEQKRRFAHDQKTRQERGLPVYPVDARFVEALERGLPACAGNAVGVDRLVALACGTTDIRTVIAFTEDEL
jgi:lysyl-tRNA synthetase class 2